MNKSMSRLNIRHWRQHAQSAEQDSIGLTTSHLCIVLVAIVTAAALTFPVSACAAESVQMQPEMGVTFTRVNYTFADTEASDSDTRETTSQELNLHTGEIVVDFAAVRAATGLDAGFLNVATAEGWVVRNLPIYAAFAYEIMTMPFQLAAECCGDVASLAAFVEFSTDPAESFAAGPFVEFPVGDIEVAIGGGDFDDNEPAVAAIDQANGCLQAQQLGLSRLALNQELVVTGNVNTDRDVVNRAARELYRCAINALWTAAALYGAPAPIGAGVNITGLAANYSGVAGVLINTIAALSNAGENFENLTTSQAIGILNTAVQAMLLAIRTDIQAAGLSGTALARLQGVANLITTLSQCGIAIYDGALLLIDTIGFAIVEVSQAFAYDITVPSRGDSSGVAAGRMCVAESSFWSLDSYLNQCYACCDQALANAAQNGLAFRVGACQSVCNAEYNSPGFFSNLFGW